MIKKVRKSQLQTDPVFRCEIFRVKRFGKGQRFLILNGQFLHINKTFSSEKYDRSFDLTASTIQWTLKEQTLIGFTVNDTGGQYQYTSDETTLLQLRKQLGDKATFSNLDGSYIVEEVIGLRESGLILTVRCLMSGDVLSAQCFEKVKLQMDQVDYSSNIEFWKQVETYRYLSKSISDKRVLRLREVFENPNFLYLITDPVEGKPIKYASQSPGDSLGLIQQTVECILLMNQYELIHRDLNPLNIFVNEGRIQIVDFSFTVRQLDHPYVHPRCGTPGYIAPEILTLSPTYKGRIDMKCDVFSLGALLFELLSDRSLFGGQSREFILQENLSYKPSLDHFDQPIKDLLKGMLQADIDERLSMSEVLSKIIQLQKEEVEVEQIDDDDSHEQFDRQLNFSNKFIELKTQYKRKKLEKMISSLQKPDTAVDQ